MSSNQPGSNTTTTQTSQSGTPKMERQKGGRGAMIAVVAIIVIVIVIVAFGYSAGWFKTGSSTKSGASCAISNSAGSSAGTPTEVELKAAGSTLVGPLMDQWATSYWNGAGLTYDASGSSGGVSALTAKTVDFGASDAPLDPAQTAALPAQVLTIPESAGGVVPIYNLPGVSADLNFNGSVLAQMFDNTITNWNNSELQALNPGVTLPSATIVPVHRSSGSGTTFIFTSFLTLENSNWASNYNKNEVWPTALSGSGNPSASGNGGEATTVSTTPDSIGYVDLNYALNSGTGIGIGNVQNPHGSFIHATVADTETALVDSAPVLPAPTDYSAWYNVSLLNAPGATDYPITSLTYVMVYQNLTAYSTYNLNYASNLVDFLHWVITTGQSYSALLYYVPLTSGIVTADNASLNSMNFGGATIPVCVPT
jgi:phosphate transport system substrate-binding protein